jgi:galactan endo-1,6-beta-galactosidase
MPNLLIFHQGAFGQGSLWCNTLQDWAWQGDEQAPDTGMAASPSAVEFNGKVYCFHQGISANGEFYCNVYDGMAWQGDFRPLGGGAHMSSSPSAVVVGGQIYCFFQGPKDNGLLYTIGFDGTNWWSDPNNPAFNTYLTHSPSAAVYNDQIYVFHQGRDTQGHANGVIWYNIYDWRARRWHGDKQMDNTPGMSFSAAPVEYQGALYVFYQGVWEKKGELHCNILDANGHWGGDFQVENTGICMSESPSAAVLDVDVAQWLYCFYQGTDDKAGQLRFTRYFHGSNGSIWNSPSDSVPDTGVSAAPGVLATNLPSPPAAVIAPRPGETRVTSFDGWGTSLCWWANQYGGATGEYGASYLADLFFGSGTVKDPKGVPLPGLGINIVRYNIGGGGGGAVIDDNTREVISPCNPVSGHTYSPCGDVGKYPYHYIWGFWKKPGPDPDEYDTSNPEYWDWTVDANQRAMLALARDRGANIFEFFSNSPPWWMCKNLSSSGGDVTNALLGNLQSRYIDKFAKYLVTVARYAREHWGINVQSVEPFNEPDPPNWFIYSPTLDIPPTFVWKNQEGCNFGCNTWVSGVLQQDVINALHDELSTAGLQDSVALTANDSNSIVFALENLGFFLEQSPEIWRKVQKVNVHGYDGGEHGLTGTHPYRGNQRTLFRQTVRAFNPGVKIWMSELGDDDKTGMTMAMSIMLDLAELQPSAWVLWQVVDPSWGLFTPGNSKDVDGGPFGSYYVFAQFSRHVRQGCKIIGETDIIGNYDVFTKVGLKNVIAYDGSNGKDGRNGKLVIVTLNPGRARWITYDLSALAKVDGPVERWETTGDAVKKYEFGKEVELKAKKFRFHCEPNSVCTFEIQGVTL